VSDWWISDAKGRVLGPVGIEVIQQLWAAQHVDARARISRDGKTWLPITKLPGFGAPEESPESRDERQRKEAQGLWERLAQLRAKAPHEIFGVAQDAPVSDYRDAFFRISKRFHPERLPDPCVQELKDASLAVFRFLSGTLSRLENDRKRGTTPPAGLPRVARPVRETSSPRMAPVAAAAEAPCPPDAYGPENFVGLRPIPNGEFEATIEVNARTVSLFYDHPLVNLRQWGAFIRGQKVLPLGTRLLVKLIFDDPETTLHARGRVIYECSQGKGIRGFGITISGLNKEERTFVETHCQKLRELGKAKAG
jgi:hypothetical protein